MRRKIEIIPIIVLIAVFIYSLFLKTAGSHWVNYFVVGLTGISVYTPIIFFTDGLITSYGYVQNGEKKLHKKDKIFYAWLIGLMIVAITYAIYLMAHN